MVLLPLTSEFYVKSSLFAVNTFKDLKEKWESNVAESVFTDSICDCSFLLSTCWLERGSCFHLWKSFQFPLLHIFPTEWVEERGCYFHIDNKILIRMIFTHSFFIIYSFLNSQIIRVLSSQSHSHFFFECSQLLPNW